MAEVPTITAQKDTDGIAWLNFLLPGGGGVMVNMEKVIASVGGPLVKGLLKSWCDQLPITSRCGEEEESDNG